MRSTVATLILIGLAAVMIGGCGSADPLSTGGFGPFASYTQVTDPISVTASLSVPRIQSGSPQGRAGSWIGAEGPAPAGANTSGFVNNGPFVQIGVNEERLLGPSGPYNHYYAFYSSEALGFHPKDLFEVKPGDLLALTMELAGGRWSMTVEDESSKDYRHLEVGARGQRYNLALWTQEDITDGRTGQPYPYPELDPVRFDDVQVNGAAPASAQATWMSLPAAVIGPGALRGDSFSVVAQHPSAAALDYQRDAFAFNEQVALLDYELQGFSEATSPATVHTVVQTWVNALSANIAQLRGGHWPARVRGAIAELVKTEVGLRAQAVSLKTTSAVRLVADRNVFFTGLDDHALVTRIRAGLGIPFGSPSNSVVTQYVRSHAR